MRKLEHEVTDNFGDRFRITQDIDGAIEVAVNGTEVALSFNQTANLVEFLRKLRVPPGYE